MWGNTASPCSKLLRPNAPRRAGRETGVHIARRGRSLAITAWFTWKRTLVVAILVVEIAVLSLVAWTARSAPADGIAVSGDQAGLDRKSVV